MTDRIWLKTHQVRTVWKMTSKLCHREKVWTEFKRNHSKGTARKSSLSFLSCDAWLQNAAGVQGRCALCWVVTILPKEPGVRKSISEPGLLTELPHLHVWWALCVWLVPASCQCTRIRASSAQMSPSLFFSLLSWGFFCLLWKMEKNCSVKNDSQSKGWNNFLQNFEEKYVDTDHFLNALVNMEYAF